ncbi:MAG TPA: hypothetical protein VH087_04035 [Thermoanaerobaculia bacterium]|nr:hypothetical protein [Thermoanaerobaculia bacterium]
MADLVRQWREARQQVRAQVISVDWDTYAFVIPAAGSLPGNFGTFFRSDFALSNSRSTPQRISVGWIARGVNNGSSPVQYFTLPASTVDFEHDFVASVLGKSGLGSVIVIAVDSAGNIDTSASIDCFSRIYTTQPSTNGTMSQDFPAIDLKDNLATSYAYGLRQDANFRTNVGLVNVYGDPQQFTVRVIGIFGSTTFTVNVQPYSMDQVALPTGNWGDLSLQVSTSLSNFNWWTAYGSTVDNRTGDGWVSHVH